MVVYFGSLVLSGKFFCSLPHHRPEVTPFSFTSIEAIFVPGVAHMCIIKLTEKGVLLGLECHETLTVKKHTHGVICQCHLALNITPQITPHHTTHTQTPTLQMSTFIHLH